MAIEDIIRKLNLKGKGGEPEGNLLYASVDPRITESGRKEQNKNLDALARLITNKETCLAIAYDYDKERLLIASNDSFDKKPWKDETKVTDHINALRDFIKNPFKKEYEELVKIAIGQAKEKIEEKTGNSSKDWHKLKQEGKMQKDLEVKWDTYKGEILAGTVDVKRIQESAKELFEAIKGDINANVKKFFRDLLLPLEDTNIVSNALVSGGIDKEVYRALRDNKIDYCGVASSNSRLHAEMKIVEKARSAGIRPKYIGISKLCCGPCWTSLGILQWKDCVAGTHGGTYPNWEAPTDSQNSNFSSDLKKKLDNQLEREKKSLKSADTSAIPVDEVDFTESPASTVYENEGEMREKMRESDSQEEKEKLEKVLTRGKERWDKQIIIQIGEIGETDAVLKAADSLFKKHKDDSLLVKFRIENKRLTLIDESSEPEFKLSEYSRIQVVFHNNDLGSNFESKELTEKVSELAWKYHENEDKTKGRKKIRSISLVCCGDRKNSEKRKIEGYAEELIKSLYEKGRGKGQGINVTRGVQFPTAEEVQIETNKGRTQYGDISREKLHYRQVGDKKVVAWVNEDKPGLDKPGLGIKVELVPITDTQKQSRTIGNVLSGSLESSAEISESGRNNTRIQIQEAFIRTEAKEQAKIYENSINRIKQANGLGEQWIPIIQNIKTSEANEHQIQFIDPSDKNNQEGKWVKMSEEDFKTCSSFKEYTNSHLQNLENHVSSYQEGMNLIEGTEAPTGLSAGFALQALFNYFQEGRHTEADNSTLGTALQIQTYLNFAQIGKDVVTDLYQVGEIVKVLNDGGLKEGSNLFKSTAISSWGGKLITGLDLAVGGANVVLDIIELKNAQSAEQKAIFGTQLGFDATGLALSAGSIGLEMAGATTAAAFGAFGWIRNWFYCSCWTVRTAAKRSYRKTEVFLAMRVRL